MRHLLCTILLLLTSSITLIAQTVGNIAYHGADPFVFESRNIIAGVGLSGCGTLAADRTCTFDATELHALTFGDGTTSASWAWTFNLNTGTDPVITFSDGVINVTTGNLQVGGSNVLTGAASAEFVCPALASWEEVTIASGAITLDAASGTLECYTVDTESDASSDSLTAINCTAGAKFVLAPNDSARTVVVTEGAGVQMAFSTFDMDHATDRYAGECSATNTITEWFRTSNGE